MIKARLVAVSLLLAAGARAAPAVLPPPRSIVYAEIAGEPARMDLYPAPASQAAPAPWLIRFSSGVEKPDALAAALHEQGYALVYASYNVGTQAMVFPPGLQLPVLTRRALRHVRAHAHEYRLDPARAGVWGWSRGGYAAALLAASAWSDRFSEGPDTNQSARVAACIAIAGGFGYVIGDEAGQDLRTWPGGDEAPLDDTTARLRRVSTWISPVMPPTLLIRGALDGDHRDARQFHSALCALGVPTDLYIKPGAGHGVSGPEVTRLVLEWADRYVRGVSAPETAPTLDAADAVARLAKAGQFEAARQVLEEGTLAETDRARARVVIDHAEGAFLIAQVATLISNQTSRAAYRLELNRLMAIASREPGLGSDLAVLIRADTARRERLSAETSDPSVLPSTATAIAWPDGLVVPPGTSDQGSDRFGAWVEITVTGRAGRATFRLRWCPLGEALLGQPPGSWGMAEPERPRRQVRIQRGFWLGETEVTQSFYQTLTGENPSFFKDRPDHPVEKINYERAEAFIAAIKAAVPGLKARLPFVDEWLWACRAGGAHVATFAGSNDIDPVGWYAGNSGASTQPVGRKRPNAWGLFDMQGNVWEWCADPSPGRPAHYRFYAGGAFCSSAGRCRPEAIGFHNRSNTTWYHGLRLLVEP